MEFLTATEPFPLFSGGVGAGKTAAFCWRAIALSVSTPYFGDLSGNTGLMGRYSMTSFMKTTYPELMKWLPRSWIRKYHKKDGILELKNESVIHFTHFDDMEHLHSYNIGWAGIDQLEQVPEEVFKGVGYERIRLTALNRFDQNGRPVDPPAQLAYQTLFATCNPKRGWVYDKFVLNEEYRKSSVPKIREKYNPSYRLISVATYENQKFLPSGYISRQKADMSQREYNRRIEGHWDAFEGKIYDDFGTHLILDQNMVPHPSWPIHIGIDHGGAGQVPSNRANNISAVSFFAVKERPGELPIIHVFAELDLPASTIEENVAAIDNKLKGIATAMKMHYNAEECSRISDRPPVRAWRCDPSMNRKNGDTPETIMETYMRHAADRGLNMPLAIGDNSIDTGLQKITWLFRKGLVAVNPGCSFFINSHNTYEYGINEQPAKGQDDHHCDGFRYNLSSLPLWVKNMKMPAKPKSHLERELDRIQRDTLMGEHDPIFGNRYNRRAS